MFLGGWTRLYKSADWTRNRCLGYVYETTYQLFHSVKTKTTQPISWLMKVKIAPLSCRMVGAVRVWDWKWIEVEKCQHRNWKFSHGAPTTGAHSVLVAPPRATRPLSLALMTQAVGNGPLTGSCIFPHCKCLHFALMWWEGSRARVVVLTSPEQPSILWRLRHVLD